jgi:lysine-ketoglutarate reductase/saccharopine dehydrogenase-like protein (TIGR00300 family)
MERTTRVRSEGHLIDSGLLRKILDQIILSGARFRIAEFHVGRTNEEASSVVIELDAASPAALAELLDKLLPLGAAALDPGDVVLRPSPADGVVPDDFYSTSNHATEVRHRGAWLPVASQRMDAVIVIDEGGAACTKLRDVRSGQLVVVGSTGIRVRPPSQERDRSHFGFMSSEISSEKRVEHVVTRLVQDMRQARAAGKKVILVAGPVLVHTGGVEPAERLLASGVISGLLAGNALAVHDIERALYNTSLGIDADSGEAVAEGHRNHMRAINAIRGAGGIHQAVRAGLLRRGIMHRCVSAGVPFVLAGSLRDDGPLPEVITDMNQAQHAYASMLDGAGIVLILATMLHGIAAGNMIPSGVLTVCVDINPAVVTKLADRGSAQAVGVVTDVGLFLSLLVDRLGAP